MRRRNELELRKYFSMNKTEQSFHMDLIVMFLIFVTTIIFVMRTYTISPGLDATLGLVEIAILGLFTAEFFIRFYYAQSYREFFASPYIWIDMIAIFPFWIGESSFQFFRILRFFRVLGYSEKYLNFRHLLDTKAFQKIFLIRIIFSIFSLIFIASSLIYVHEANINPSIHNFDDAIYFSIVTVTTLGYGDITPVTNAGRWTMMFVVLIGMVLIPWHISTLIRFAGQTGQKAHIECKKCKLMYHDSDAVYCKSCGTQLFKRYVGDISYGEFRNL